MSVSPRNRAKLGLVDLIKIYKGGKTLACLGYVGIALVVLRQLATKDIPAEGASDIEQQERAANHARLILDNNWKIRGGGDPTRVNVEDEMCTWIVSAVHHVCGVDCPPELTRKTHRAFRAALLYFSAVPAGELTEEILFFAAGVISTGLAPKGHIAWNMAKLATARLLRTSDGVDAVNTGRQAALTAIVGCVDDALLPEGVDSDTVSSPEKLEKKKVAAANSKKTPAEKAPAKSKMKAKKPSTSTKRQSRPKTESKPMKTYTKTPSTEKTSSSTKQSKLNFHPRKSAAQEPVEKPKAGQAPALVTVPISSEVKLGDISETPVPCREELDSSQSPLKRSRLNATGPSAITAKDSSADLNKLITASPLRIVA
jgi:hypothetical protein